MRLRLTKQKLQCGKKRKIGKKTETVISQNLDPGGFGPLVLRPPQMGEGAPTESTNAFSAVSDLNLTKKKMRPIPKKKIAKGREIVGNQFYRCKYYNEQANRQPDMVVGRNLIRVLTIKIDIGVRIIQNMMACIGLKSKYDNFSKL